LPPPAGRATFSPMAAPAIQVLPDDSRIGLIGVRFPVELRIEGFEPSQPGTWPSLEGRLEYLGGRLLYMPPCADYQQDVAMDVAYVLRSWSEPRPEFIVGGNEAGMKLGQDLRAADVAVWRTADAGQRSGRVRSVPPILAVEIAGEDEEERVLRDKARWYLEHGVLVVWLVLPESREVVVITPAGEKRVGRGEHSMLPELEPEVVRFFAQLDRR
jgi:Uma2 family endonuclease